jgi:uncharacterized zinc-type alcohol dehydrogenase-like protein
MKTRAWAALAAGQPLQPHPIERRALRADDVAIDISHCGVCHSDVHQARNEWQRSAFPMVPGHEIVGRVRAVGAAVRRFAVGDRVGVGCMVDACGACSSCLAGEEQFCDKGPAFTYNSTELDRQTPTFGGYCRAIVVRDRFVLRIPEGLDAAGAAPLLCAGVTTYSSLRQWGTKRGDRVAVVGLGGLGHMAVKIAALLGAEVTLLSTSPGKEADARRFGARDFHLLHEATGAKARGLDHLARRFDLVLDTSSGLHDYGAMLRTLRPHGAMVLLGLPSADLRFAPHALIGGNRRLAGSLIGGIAETQALLDLCGQHRITAEVEVIPMDRINEAYARMLRSDVRYRFVIDLASLDDGA